MDQVAAVASPPGALCLGLWPHTQLKLSYCYAKPVVEERSMYYNRWLGRGLWELFAILFWVAMLAALVMAIYEFLSGPTFVGWRPD